MRLIPSDPDIETLLRRIERGELDLQPDFQRGEVWSQKKQKLLIDSILRDWHVPPIHVVETNEGEEVLDGQQRLVAIRQFHQGRLKVYGNADPKAEEIIELNGLTFHELPDLFKRRFLGFSIRFFKIVDYSTEEPAELFYRLNQPVTLTAPEQRNAFFGSVRDQVRNLVSQHSMNALDKEFLGFSNARMALDDVLARVCFVIESKTLREKVTAQRLASRYRNPQGFPKTVLERVDEALEVFGKSKDHVLKAVRFNKATLFTWLYFFSKAQGFHQTFESNIGSFISIVEVARQQLRTKSAMSDNGLLSAETTSRLISLLHDRASSRVGDVFSLIARDFVIWGMFYSLWQQLGLKKVASQNSGKLDSVEFVCSRLETWSPPPIESIQRNDTEQDIASFEKVLESLLTEVGWEKSN